MMPDSCVFCARAPAQKTKVTNGQFLIKDVMLILPIRRIQAQFALARALDAQVSRFLSAILVEKPLGECSTTQLRLASTLGHFDRLM